MLNKTILIPTEEEFDLAKDILMNLLSMGAHDCLNSGCYHDRDKAFVHWMENNNMGGQGFKWNYGVTKACIISDMLERWIIKFSFEDIRYDYCEIEFENYQKAIQEGYAEYFPATYFLERAFGINFFLQEYADEAEEEVSDILYAKMTDELICDGEDPDGEWFGDLVADAVDDIDDIYKIEILFDEDTEFGYFLRRNNINDLHTGNFGVINGSLVIIDFSGYKGV